MVNKGRKAILEYKKALFLAEVEKASTNLKVIKPKVKFWKQYEDHFDRDERAHIHTETNTICIAEPELEMMSEEDIKTTATHEVSHTHHHGHGGDFYDTHANLEIASWQPSAGTTGAIPEEIYHATKHEKVKTKIIKTVCNYHLCSKKKDLSRCHYCEKYYCKEHKKPHLAGMPRFKSYKSEDLNFLEKAYAGEGHPCPPYYNILKKKREKEDIEYGKALDRLSGKSKSLFIPQKKLGKRELKSLIEKNLDSSQKVERTEEIREEPIQKVGERKYPQKMKKRSPVSVNKSGAIFFSILFLIIIGIFCIWFMKNNSESSPEPVNMPRMVFETINKFRIQNNLSVLAYNPNSYELAVYLSKQFYETNSYSVSSADLSTLSLKYQLTGVGLLSQRLDNLEESQFDFLIQRWSGEKIFVEKTMNSSFSEGAIGCYKEACVFVLNT